MTLNKLVLAAFVSEYLASVCSGTNIFPFLFVDRLGNPDSLSVPVVGAKNYQGL